MCILRPRELASLAKEHGLRAAPLAKVLRRPMGDPGNGDSQTEYSATACRTLGTLHRGQSGREKRTGAMGQHLDQFPLGNNKVKAADNLTMKPLTTAETLRLWRACRLFAGVFGRSFRCRAARRRSKGLAGSNRRGSRSRLHAIVRNRVFFLVVKHDWLDLGPARSCWFGFLHRGNEPCGYGFSRPLRPLVSRTFHLTMTTLYAAAATPDGSCPQAS